MTTQAIHSVLAMMKMTAQQAAGTTITLSASGNADAGFISELNSSIKQINGMQINARRKAEKFELGVPGTALNDVMVEIQKASLALHLGIQVNNKLINAYQVLGIRRWSLSKAGANSGYVELVLYTIPVFRWL